jgi:hypothetical protein
MSIRLIVVADFGDRKRGDAITDQAEADAVLASHPNNVVRVIPPAGEE